jgi:hypothetical protein
MPPDRNFRAFRQPKGNGMTNTITAIAIEGAEGPPEALYATKIDRPEPGWVKSSSRRRRPALTGRTSCGGWLSRRASDAWP